MIFTPVSIAALMNIGLVAIIIGLFIVLARIR
jgi:hypothetical protein